VVICLQRGADCLHMVQLMPLHPKTSSSLASFKSRLVLPFWHRLTRVVLEKRPLNGCIVVVVVQYEYRSLLASCLGSVITRSITACCSCSVVVLVVLEMLHARTHTHTHPFNGPLFRTTRVSRYQKGKTNLDFTAARDSEWQWAVTSAGPCASPDR